MGLFGSKKHLPAITDVFSADAIKKILDVAGPKLTCNSYGKYTDYAEILLSALANPAQEQDKRGWDRIMFSAGVMTKVEPELTAVLTDAIAKYKALKKNG